MKNAACGSRKSIAPAVSFVQLDLELAGIRVEEDEPSGLVVLGPWHGARVKVHDRLSGAVEAHELALAHPEHAWLLFVERVEGPAIAKPER